MVEQNDFKDYYENLEIKSSALKEDIKKAYIKLSRQYHPDKNNGDKEKEEQFKEVNEAYETLYNENKREEYDEKYKKYMQKDEKWFEETLKKYNAYNDDLLGAVTLSKQDSQDFVKLREIIKSVSNKNLDIDEANLIKTRATIDLAESPIQKRFTEIIDSKSWEKVSLNNNGKTIPAIRFNIDKESHKTIKELSEFLSSNNIHSIPKYSTSSKSFVVEISGEQDIEKFKKLQENYKDHIIDKEMDSINGLRSANFSLKKKFSDEELKYLKVKTKFDLENQIKTDNKVSKISSSENFLKEKWTQDLSHDGEAVIFLKTDHANYKNIGMLENHLKQNGIKNITRPYNNDLQSDVIQINGEDNINKFKALQEAISNNKQTTKKSPLETDTQLDAKWFKQAIKKYNAYNEDLLGTVKLSKQDSQDFQILKDIQKSVKTKNSTNLNPEELLYSIVNEKLNVKKAGQKDLSDTKGDFNPSLPKKSTRNL